MQSQVFVTQPPESVTQPRQFGIIDLFATLTVAALVCAVLAPLLRDMPPQSLTRLSLSAGMQFTVSALAFAITVAGRQRVLSQAGTRLGIAYCGQISWRHWPVVKSVIYMGGVALVQLGLALLFAIGLKGHVFASYYFVYQIQLASFAGLAVARYLWRVYPNSIEFFQHGVALRGICFVPWAQVKVRQSWLYSERLVVTARRDQESVVAETQMALVSAGLRQRIMAAADAAPVNPTLPDEQRMMPDTAR